MMSREVAETGCAGYIRDGSLDMTTDRRHRLLTGSAALAASILLASCSTGGSADPVLAGPAARVGVDPVPRVDLFEHHSTALISWRTAGVRDRILVHLDGHADFDWVPDETVERIAASRPEDLHELELHPYALDDTVHRRFAIWNFVYPAARLGMVREFWWVVPDGTLSDPGSAQRLVREVVVGKIEMITVEEASALSVEGRTVRGRILGVPINICEIADLPAFSEPVLLDVDLDYLTTVSAVSMSVTQEPWIHPNDVLGILRDKGVETDLATISLSTVGGYMPTSQRWMGAYFRDRLTAPGSTETPGSAADAVEDPLLVHETLFEADRLRLNRDWAGALPLFQRYVEEHPDSPFRPYALRRVAKCRMLLRRDDEAIETFQQVLEIAPSHGDSLLDLGILYRSRNDLDRAILYLREARKALPDRAEYAMALGTTYLMMGRTEEGVAELSIAVARRPCLVRARRNLAAALLELGRAREAAEHVRAALRVDPTDVRLRQMAARLESGGIDVGGGS
jgi:hypothetical protein